MVHTRTIEHRYYKMLRLTTRSVHALRGLWTSLHIYQFSFLLGTRINEIYKIHNASTIKLYHQGTKIIVHACITILEQNFSTMVEQNHENHSHKTTSNNTNITEFHFVKRGTPYRVHAYITIIEQNHSHKRIPTLLSIVLCGMFQGYITILCIELDWLADHK